MKVSTGLKIAKNSTVESELKAALKAVKKAHELSMGNYPSSYKQANRLAELTHTIYAELSNYYHEG